MAQFRVIVEIISLAVDAVGIAVVIIGALVATFRFLLPGRSTTYRTFRRDLGRAIMLGLEFLVAGDIIRTVVIEPTLESVLSLALIVLIRTFLSITLEVEVEGHWPWQRADRT